MSFPARFPIVFFVSFACSCTSGPSNTVGAAYDADSSYCRKLVSKMAQPIGVSHNTPSTPNQPPPTDHQLYEQMCEPVGAWQARDGEGHDSTIAYENSFFNKLLHVFR